MNNNEDQVTIEWKEFGEGFVSDLWQFYNSDKFSDVTITTEDGHEIKSHRILLAMCSSYFNELFKRHTTPGHIVCLSNFNSNIILKVFALIYGGMVQIERSKVDNFVKAAKYLKLHGFDDVNIKDIDNLLMDRQRAFSLKLKRVELPQTGSATKHDIPQNDAVQQNHNSFSKSPAMNAFVSSTINPTPDDVQFFPSLSDSDSDS